MTAPFVFMIAATVGEVVSITVTYPTKLFSIKCTGNGSCEGAFRDSEAKGTGKYKSYTI